MPLIGGDVDDKLLQAQSQPKEAAARQVQSQDSLVDMNAVMAAQQDINLDTQNRI